MGGLHELDGKLLSSMQQHFSRKRYTISKLQLTLLPEAKWKLCRFVTAPYKTATSLYHIDWNKANFFQMVSVNRLEAFYLTRYLPTVIAYLSDLRFDFTNQFWKKPTLRWGRSFLQSRITPDQWLMTSKYFGRLELDLSFGWLSSANGKNTIFS